VYVNLRKSQGRRDFSADKMGRTFLLIMLFRTKRENVSSLAPHVLISLSQLSHRSAGCTTPHGAISRSSRTPRILCARFIACN